MMDSIPYVPAERPAFDAAFELIATYGPLAADEAALRAIQSRDAGNVIRFCHWRQTERAIALLAQTEAFGRLH